MVCTAQTKPDLARNLGPKGARPQVTGFNSGRDSLKLGHRLKWGLRGSPEELAPLHVAPAPRYLGGGPWESPRVTCTHRGDSPFPVYN